MWQVIKAFFGAPLSKAGALAAIKVWQAALAITVITASAATITYVRLNTPHTATGNIDQKVVVFISGLNTSLTDCQEGTFEDYGHGRFLPLLLSETTGMADPYIKGCNQADLNRDYFSAPSSMMRFSYMGGVMDSHGFWKPYNYNACSSVNKFSITQDIKIFDEMLDNYHKLFPNARFTIIGHSLGGLVGLQGAYDYVVNKGNRDIDKVISIDSPLKGVQPSTSPGSELWRQFIEKNCLHTGPVMSDLLGLGSASLKAAETHQGIICDDQQSGLSWCKGQVLAQKGVGVITLGNNQDSLFCGGSTQSVASLDYTCYTQTLGSAHLVLSKTYDLTPLPDEGYQLWNLGHTSLGNGHLTIISEQQTQLDIVRYILAPVVTMHQPALQTSKIVSLQGTGLPFSSTVHCLWGMANPMYVTAQVFLKDGTSLFAGTSISTDRSDMLAINGIVNLPSSQNNTTGTFYVEAGSDACQYPSGIDSQIHAKVLPTDRDYFGGKTTGISFVITHGTPSTQIFSASSQSQPSNSSDDARLLARSSDFIVQAGQSFNVYFDYENTGNTTWSDTNNYQLACSTTNKPGANCMGGISQGLNGVQVPPGYQTTFYMTLTAPLSPGTYHVIWQMALNGKSFVKDPASMNIKVTPAPIAYISFNNDLYALNALNGKMFWHFQLSGDYTTFFAFLTSANGMVYFGSKNNVYALDTSSGKPRWTFQVGESSYGSLMQLDVVNDRLYAFTREGLVYALNANNGTLLWRYQYVSNSSSNIFYSAVVRDGSIYYGTNEGHVFALNASNGSLLWQAQTANSSNLISVRNGILCIASQTSNGGEMVYVFQPGDGAELWHYSVESPGNDSLPVIGNGIIYIGMLENLDAFDANSGKLLWQQPAEIVDGLSFNDKIVYATESDGYLHAFNANTGTLLWKFNVTLLAGSPTITNGALYVEAGFDGALGRVFVLNAVTGSQFWSYQAKDYHNPGGTSVITVDIAYGSIYVDDGRYVHVFKANDGTPLWDFDTGSFGRGVAQVVASLGNS